MYKLTLQVEMHENMILKHDMKEEETLYYDEHNEIICNIISYPY